MSENEVPEEVKNLYYAERKKWEAEGYTVAMAYATPQEIPVDEIGTPGRLILYVGKRLPGNRNFVPYSTEQICSTETGAYQLAEFTLWMWREHYEAMRMKSPLAVAATPAVETKQMEKER